MPSKRIKVTEIKDEPASSSYDEVVQEVATPEPEPAKEEVTNTEPETQKEEGKPKATCEHCGKTMTVKNLKYAHHLICPAIDRNEPDEEVITPIEEEVDTPKKTEEHVIKTKLKRTTTKKCEPEVEKPKP